MRSGFYSASRRLKRFGSPAFPPPRVSCLVFYSAEACSARHKTCRRSLFLYVLLLCIVVEPTGYGLLVLPRPACPPPSSPDTTSRSPSRTARS